MQDSLLGLGAPEGILGVRGTDGEMERTRTSRQWEAVTEEKGDLIGGAWGLGVAVLEALGWRGVGTRSRLQTWRKGQARQDQEGWQQSRCVEREEGWGRPRLCTFGGFTKGRSLR